LAPHTILFSSLFFENLAFRNNNSNYIVHILGGGKVVIGQEQDAGGAFSQPESFVGLLTNLNLWSKELTFTQIENMIVTCDKVIGDVIAWPDVQSGVQKFCQVFLESLVIICGVYWSV
jgi:hypothetical protein